MDNPNVSAARAISASNYPQIREESLILRSLLAHMTGQVRSVSDWSNRTLRFIDNVTPMLPGEEMRRRGPSRRRVVWCAKRLIVVGLVFVIALAALQVAVTRADPWQVSELLGIGTGTIAAPSIPPATSPDPFRVGPPQVLTETAAAAGVEQRIDDLRARYESWLNNREERVDAEAVLDELTDDPRSVADIIPPLPDAPDGEITRQRELVELELVP